MVYECAERPKQGTHDHGTEKWLMGPEPRRTDNGHGQNKHSREERAGMDMDEREAKRRQKLAYAAAWCNADAV